MFDMSLSKQRLSLAPLPVHVQQVAEDVFEVTVLPNSNDQYFVFIICSPPGSGKSTLIANMLLREEYGYRGRKKILFSKQAKAGMGADNPYDPAVINDKEVECFAVQHLSEAENVFTQISLRVVKQGEPKGVIFVDDFGAEINRNGWLSDWCERGRQEGSLHCDFVICMQNWNYRSNLKNLCTHVAFYQPCILYDTASWKRKFRLGQWGRRKTKAKQEEIIDTMLHTALCPPEQDYRQKRFNFVLIHRNHLLPDGTNPIFVNLTHFISAAVPSVLQRIPEEFSIPALVIGESLPTCVDQYAQARNQGQLQIERQRSVPTAVLAQGVSNSSSGSGSGSGSFGQNAQLHDCAIINT